MFAVLLVSVALVVSSLSGGNEALCKAMGGKYAPNNVAEQCPGGKWANLVAKK